MKKLFVYTFISFTAMWHFHAIGQPAVAAGTLHQVEGRITDVSGQAVAGKTVYLTVAAPRYEVRTAVSDPQGYIRFLVPDLSGKGQLVFQYDSKTDSNLIITTEKDFMSRYSSANGAATGYIYQDTSFFYGSPDKSYPLDDYTRFATLEEVFREFVAEVKLSKQGDNFRLNVFNKPFNHFFDDSPLVLLDGVPVFDHNRLMELDPLRIKAIDVVARRYYLGRILCNGLVCLYSYKADMAGYSLPFRAHVRDVMAGE